MAEQVIKSDFWIRLPAVAPPNPRPVLADGDTIIGTFGKRGVDSIHACVTTYDQCLAAKISRHAWLARPPAPGP